MSSLLPWPQTYLLPALWSGVARLLERGITLGREGALPATLLLVSPSGLGREALAVELAASLVCRDTTRPGCRCSSCDRVRRGLHPDVAILAVLPGNKEIQIDQIREVVDGINQRPFEGRQRVVIVANAHTPPLNAHSASALLKTLEEPPSHLTALLLASNPAHVLPTILSRAVELRVPPPSLDEALAWLAEAHDLAAPAAEQLLARTDGDVAAAAQALDEELAELPAGLAGFLPSAAGGSALAVLQVASLLRRAPHALPLVVAELVRLAARSLPEHAEALLGGAAALLAAERRRRVLHLDLEAAAVGALAPLVTSASRT